MSYPELLLKLTAFLSISQDVLSSILDSGINPRINVLDYMHDYQA
jgi:hypothetical protein